MTDSDLAFVLQYKFSVNVSLNLRTSALSAKNSLPIRMYNPGCQGFLFVLFTIESPKLVVLQ